MPLPLPILGERRSQVISCRFSLGLTPLSAPGCCRTILTPPPATAHRPPSSDIVVLRRRATSPLLELVGDPPFSSPCLASRFSLSGALPATMPHLIGSPATASALGAVTAQSAHHVVRAVPGRLCHWAKPSPQGHGPNSGPTLFTHLLIHRISFQI
jgi:hypothetical protein